MVRNTHELELGGVNTATMVPLLADLIVDSVGAFNLAEGWEDAYDAH